VDAFATVNVGGAAQVSGTTVNSFASPVTYAVTSQDGTSSTNYTVTVTVTPAETDNTIKSGTGTNVSASYKKKVIPAFIDNSAKTIVVYDTTIKSSKFDSVRVDYVLNGKFATASMKSDTLLNLTSSKTITITAQDGTTATYTIYAVAAPILTLQFNALFPAVSATTTNFGISADVLKGTDVTTLVTSHMIKVPSGVTVAGITANGNAYTDGMPLDFSSKVVFVLTLIDGNSGHPASYQVTYTAIVNVVQ
jgi:hypothetical protein